MGLLLKFEIAVDLQNGVVHNPRNIQIVFVGDLIDRGPYSRETLIAFFLLRRYGAVCTVGNHDCKLYRYLIGNPVQTNEDLDRVIDSLTERDEETFVHFLRDMPMYVVLPFLQANHLAVVSHGGIPRSMMFRQSKGVEQHCKYGELAGTDKETGLPIRGENWIETWDGDDMCFYGHVARPEVYVKNNTYGIDTGCVFGGKLTGVLLCGQTGQIKEIEAINAYESYSSHGSFNDEESISG